MREISSQEGLDLINAWINSSEPVGAWISPEPGEEYRCLVRIRFATSRELSLRTPKFDLLLPIDGGRFSLGDSAESPHARDWPSELGMGVMVQILASPASVSLFGSPPK